MYQSIVRRLSVTTMTIRPITTFTAAPAKVGISFPMITKEKSKSLDNMTRLLNIEEKLEEAYNWQEHQRRQTIVEMFLAGPEAWPDYPFDETLVDEDLLDEEEIWIPLNAACSSDGEK